MFVCELVEWGENFATIREILDGYIWANTNHLLTITLVNRIPVRWRCMFFMPNICRVVLSSAQKSWRNTFFFADFCHFFWSTHFYWCLEICSILKFSGTSNSTIVRLYTEFRHDTNHLVDFTAQKRLKIAIKICR